MFEFSWPWAFLLLPLPLLVYWLIPKAQQEQSGLKVPFYKAVAGYSRNDSASMTQLKPFKFLLLSCVWLLLLCSAAKPQWLGDEVAVPTSGRDLLVAVDISMSMSRSSMIVQGRRVPFINVVKYIVGEFIEKRKGDRLGLVLFGSNAYLQSPLTFDRATVKDFLHEAMPGFAGEQTAIGDAIGLAVKRLRDRPDGKKVLILLTDGQNTSGEIAPQKAADLAAQAGVKIYTVGIGDNANNLDEQTLQYVAQKTNGQYFRAESPEQLNQIYNLFDTLEPIEHDDETFRPVHSLYYYPLSFALMLSFFITLLYTQLIPSFSKAQSKRTLV